MHHFHVAVMLFLLTLLNCNISFAIIHEDKYHDYRSQYIEIDLLKMQEFHLQQAQIKLKKGQVEYAWGDFAYLLCYVPNHHEILQQMQHIAPQLNKTAEMIIFFEKAINIFPNDAIIHAIYSSFLNKTGDTINANKHSALALKINPNLSH